MKRKSRAVGPLAGLCAGLALGWVLWGDARPQAPRWVHGLFEDDPVLVFVVGEQADVAAVRDAVAAERIVARSEAGFAVEPERLVVASLEGAGPILTEAGWEDRPLEIVELAPRSEGDQGADARAERIASMVSRPTLTLGEAYLMLGSSAIP